MSGAIQFYKGSRDKNVVVKDAAGVVQQVKTVEFVEWRWRLVADNGRIVASSSEGFYSRGNAVRNARLANRLMEKALGR
jgi:hypothetical protein